MEEAKQAARLRYDALPSIGRELLIDWIRGGVAESSFIDGTTHNARAWTGRSVANLLMEEIGEFDHFVLRPAGSGTQPPCEVSGIARRLMLDDVVLNGDGSIGRTAAYDAYVANAVDPVHSPASHKRTMPFNKFYFDEHDRPNAAAINPAAFQAIRSMLEWNRQWVALRAQESRGRETAKIAAERSERRGHILWMCFAALLAGVVLLTVGLFVVGLFVPSLR